MKDTEKLFKAIKENNFMKFQELLSKHLYVGMRDDDDYTLLHRAAQLQDSRFVEALLEKGADTSARARWRWTPLHEAANCGNINTTIALLEGGAKIESFSDWAETPLIIAVHRRKVPIIRLLLDYGANPHETNKLGQNALHIIVMSGKEYLTRERSLVKLFLEEGVWVDSIYNNLTPLQHAMDRENYGFVWNLLDHGADTNVFNNAGLTPLHQAVMGGQVKIVKALIEKNANVNALTKGSDNWTPLHKAIEIGNQEIIKLLLEKGADPTILSKCGLSVNDSDKSPHRNSIDLKNDSLGISNTLEHLKLKLE